jgi:hypothetical protein
MAGVLVLSIYQPVDQLLPTLGDGVNPLASGDCAKEKSLLTAERSCVNLELTAYINLSFLPYILYHLSWVNPLIESRKERDNGLCFTCRCIHETIPA